MNLTGLSGQPKMLARFKNHLRKYKNCLNNFIVPEARHATLISINAGEAFRLHYDQALREGHRPDHGFYKPLSQFRIG